MEEEEEQQQQQLPGKRTVLGSISSQNSTIGDRKSCIEDEAARSLRHDMVSGPSRKGPRGGASPQCAKSSRRGVADMENRQGGGGAPSPSGSSGPSWPLPAGGSLHSLHSGGDDDGEEEANEQGRGRTTSRLSLGMGMRPSFGSVKRMAARWPVSPARRGVEAVDGPVRNSSRSSICSPSGSARLSVGPRSAPFASSGGQGGVGAIGSATAEFDAAIRASAAASPPSPPPRATDSAGGGLRQGGSSDSLEGLSLTASSSEADEEADLADEEDGSGPVDTVPLRREAFANSRSKGAEGELGGGGGEGGEGGALVLSDLFSASGVNSNSGGNEGAERPSTESGGSSSLASTAHTDAEGAVEVEAETGEGLPRGADPHPHPPLPLRNPHPPLPPPPVPQRQRRAASTAARFPPSPLAPPSPLGPLKPRTPRSPGTGKRQTYGGGDGGGTTDIDRDILADLNLYRLNKQAREAREGAEEGFEFALVLKKDSEYREAVDQLLKAIEVREYGAEVVQGLEQGQREDILKLRDSFGGGDAPGRPLALPHVPNMFDSGCPGGAGPGAAVGGGRGRGRRSSSTGSSRSGKARIPRSPGGRPVLQRRMSIIEDLAEGQNTRISDRRRLELQHRNAQRFERFKERLKEGVKVLLHRAHHTSKECFLQSRNDCRESVQWAPLDARDARKGVNIMKGFLNIFKKDSGVLPTGDIMEVLHAVEADPSHPGFYGTRNLRLSLDYYDAARTLSVLVRGRGGYVDLTLDLECSSDIDYATLFQGFLLLKMRRVQAEEEQQRQQEEEEERLLAAQAEPTPRVTPPLDGSLGLGLSASGTSAPSGGGGARSRRGGEETAAPADRLRPRSVKRVKRTDATPAKVKRTEATPAKAAAKTTAKASADAAAGAGPSSLKKRLAESLARPKSMLRRESLGSEYDAVAMLSPPRGNRSPCAGSPRLGGERHRMPKTFGVVRPDSPSKVVSDVLKRASTAAANASGGWGCGLEEMEEGMRRAAPGGGKEGRGELSRAREARETKRLRDMLDAYGEGEDDEDEEDGIEGSDSLDAFGAQCQVESTRQAAAAKKLLRETLGGDEGEETETEDEEEETEDEEDSSDDDDGEDDCEGARSMLRSGLEGLHKLGKLGKDKAKEKAGHVRLRMGRMPNSGSMRPKSGTATAVMERGVGPPPLYFLGWNSAGTKIWSRLRMASLQVEKLHSLHRDEVMLKIRLTKERQEQVAEEIGVKLRKRDGTMGKYKASRERAFTGVGPGRQSVFRTSESQAFIDYAVRSKVQAGGAMLDEGDELGKAVAKRLPLHNRQKLDELYREWVTYWRPSHPRPRPSFKSALPRFVNDVREMLDNSGAILRGAGEQPLEEVADYFGEAIAFYFAWMQFYTRWLVVPSFFGVILFACQVRARNLDHPLGPLYSALMLLWSTAFLVKWRQQCSRMAYRRGVLDFEVEERQRPQFRGAQQAAARQKAKRQRAAAAGKGAKGAAAAADQQQQASQGGGLKGRLGRLLGKAAAAAPSSTPKDEGKLEQGEASHPTAGARVRVPAPAATVATGGTPSSPLAARAAEFEGKEDFLLYPDWKRWLTYCFTVPASFSFTACVLWGMVKIFQIRDVEPPTSLQDMQSLGFWGHLLLFPCLYGIAIPMLYQACKVIGEKLCNMENHEFESQYRNSLIVKVFSFRFVTVFASLYYFAFWSDQGSSNWRMLRLAASLLTFMTVGQWWYMTWMTYIPYKLQSRKITKLREAVAQEHEKIEQLMEGGGGADGTDAADEATVLKREFRRTLLKQARSSLWEEAELKEYDLFDDYTMSLIQFGYVTLFSMAFPLAPLIALVNNLVQIRVDAYKLCRTRRRPVAVKTSGIGVWDNVLEVMTFVAVITSCGIVGRTSQQLWSWLPALDDTWKFFVMVIIEHAILFLKYWLESTVPRVPQSVVRRQMRARKEREAEAKGRRKFFGAAGGGGRSSLEGKRSSVSGGGGPGMTGGRRGMRAMGRSHSMQKGLSTPPKDKTPGPADALEQEVEQEAAAAGGGAVPSIPSTSLFAPAPSADGLRRRRCSSHSHSHQGSGDGVVGAGDGGGSEDGDAAAPLWGGTSQSIIEADFAADDEDSEDSSGSGSEVEGSGSEGEGSSGQRRLDPIEESSSDSD